MKRITTILFLMGLIFGEKCMANANCLASRLTNSCTPSGNWRDQTKFFLYADYLYWTVTRPEYTLNILQQTVPSTSFQAFFFTPGYSSGYRIGAGATFKCFDFDARYSFLQNKTNEQNSTQNVDFSDVSTTLYHLNYRVLDLAIGYSFCMPYQRGYFKPYGGAKLSWLDENIENVFSTVFEEVNVVFTSILNTKDRGIGPMVGFEGRLNLFRLCLPIYLIGRADISLLNMTFSILNEESAVNTPASEQSIFLNDQSFFVMVQDIYVALGVDLWKIGCFDANFELGYETQTWTNLRGLTDEVVILPGGQLGLGGLVAHFNLSF